MALPETMGPGCAFIDYDNDGYPGILLVKWHGFCWACSRWSNHAKAISQQSQWNLQGRWKTRQAGLAVPMFGLGVSVGDYDNDGLDDLFITALGQSRLFHNNGNGTFY